MPPKPPVRGSSPTEPGTHGVAESLLRGPMTSPLPGGTGTPVATGWPWHSPAVRATLSSARLLVGAAEGGEQPLDELEFPGLATDIGPHAGTTEALWQWARIDWKAPRALIGVQVEASNHRSAPSSHPAGRARACAFSTEAAGFGAAGHPAHRHRAEFSRLNAHRA